MLRLSPRTRLIVTVLAASLLVGVVAAKLNAQSRDDVSAAATNVLIDFPGPSVVDRDANSADVANLQSRAELYGRLLVTDPVLDRVARRAGLPPGQIAGIARTTASVPISLREPGSEVRAAQIRDTRVPYHLELQARTTDPILSIYSQAPTTAEAERLGDAAVLGLRDYLRDLARQQGFKQGDQPVLRQLGRAHGGPVSPHARLMTAVLTFFVAFSLTCALGFGLAHLRRRRLGLLDDRPLPEPDPDDNWPHTSRLLPWLIAGFICMLWLTPFNKIQLAMSTPVDMKLDRLVLPIIFAVWLLAFAARGQIAPRLRMTPVHCALAVFLGVAFMSVVINAGALNQMLEFQLSFKKLPLLVSYLSIFVIVASSVRPGEVRSFFKLTLILSVITAVGIIYEFRFGRNLFTVYTAKLLPGFFTLDADPSGIGGLDSVGRRSIIGPTDVGLEAVTMLSMALPIVIVGLLATKQRKHRILYGLAACLLVAGMFATGRKIALIAPASIVLTLMYFRRRELLSLAPLGLVLVIVVTALSPGAVHGVVSQFTRSDRATVATTSDRTADYDAIRPDLWTHLLVGRGYGSYTPDTYRILDSEILTRLVDTGVLGLLAFLGIGLSVVFAARKTIARRDQQSSPVALVATAGAVCFLTVSTLYDVSGFPHATYVFLYIAGLGTVVLGRRPQPESEPAFLDFDDLPEFDARKSVEPVPVGLTWESASDCEPSGTSASA